MPAETDVAIAEQHSVPRSTFPSSFTKGNDAVEPTHKFWQKMLDCERDALAHRGTHHARLRKTVPEWCIRNAKMRQVN